MITYKGKTYRPTKLLMSISFTIAFLMAFKIESAKTFKDMIIPFLVMIVSSYFALGGKYE